MTIPVYDDETARQAVRHLRKSDPVMKELIAQVGPPALKPRRSRFESLARAILSQQISTSAARSIWKRLRETLPTSRVTPAALSSVDDSALRAVGVSPQKLGYLRDLERHFLDGHIRTRTMGRRTDEEIITELTQVKGIGVWTAQMFLMFSLGRLDVLPHGDLGIRSAIRSLYKLDDLPDEATCVEIARPWRPYATVACWYCWRSTEL